MIDIHISADYLVDSEACKTSEIFFNKLKNSFNAANLSEDEKKVWADRINLYLEVVIRDKENFPVQVNATDY